MVINEQVLFIFSSMNEGANQFEINKLLKQYSGCLNSGGDKQILKHLTQSSIPATNLRANDFSLQNYSNSDARSIIEKLIKTKKVMARGSAPAEVWLTPILTATENKIFNEVITTMDEIEQLKTLIAHQKSIISKLDPNFDFKTLLLKAENTLPKFNPQTPQSQVQSIKKQNRELQSTIRSLSQQKNPQLLENLAFEKNRFRELKSIAEENQNVLQEDAILSNPQSQTTIDHLNRKIAEIREQNEFLQLNINSRPLFANPQIQKIKDQNNRLRAKTVKGLKSSSVRFSQQQQELLLYLQNQEEKKQELYEQIKAFKLQLLQIERENQKLRDRRTQKYSHTYSPWVQSKISRNNFSEAEEVINSMDRLLGK